MRMIVSHVRSRLPQIYLSLKSRFFVFVQKVAFLIVFFLRQDQTTSFAARLNSSLTLGFNFAEAKVHGVSFVNQFVSHLDKSVVGSLDAAPDSAGLTGKEEGHVDW